MNSGSGLFVDAALFLGNGALAILAVLVARYRVFVRLTRRLAVGLSLVGLLVGLVFGLGAATEMWGTDYPLVRPGQPFGSYAQPTDLLLLEMMGSAVVVVSASLLALRHPRAAAGLFVVAGAWNLLGSIRQYQDATMPPGNATFGVAFAGLPPLVVAALLLAVWWAARSSALAAAGHRV